MLRANQNVRDRFLSFLRLLASFHDNYGIKESQAGFAILAKICTQMRELIVADNIPAEANTIISTLSGVIQTHLPRIAASILENSPHLAEKGNRISLMESVVRIVTNLNRMVAAYESCLANAQSSASTSLLRTQDSTADSGQPPVSADMIDDPLLRLIESLNYLPEREEDPVLVIQRDNHQPDEEQLLLPQRMPQENTSSCYSFFGRTFYGYQKSIMAGTGFSILGLGYWGLSSLSLFIGEELDKLIHSDQTGVHHNTIFALALILLGVTACASAAVRSACANSASRDHDVESGLIMKM
ncbi:hypothetical protein AQUSIP_00870 [Aquicella siphonis]|uniref:Uncharacterized protein n=1 Tax=Aquicella siphonis TaxID=254247 RepID=A0A5E4PE02_9COXI|nr:hypothetical protein [Aquicella siphonis]VVC74815.1 hypothetical protein AQUSIP_00870 [Aquicella siphonis]